MNFYVFILAQINYALYCPIIHALKIQLQYLMGRRFLLKINNLGLKYIFEQPNLNARQSRWLDFLSEYNFESMHIKDKENKFDVSLSQKNMWYMN